MKILCFGSLNLDHVYRVDHIVKPGETTTSADYKIYEGGKGLNQAIALGRANAPCSMAGIIGKDGLQLLGSLKESFVNTDFIKVTGDRTGHAMIQVDRNGQNSILIFPGANEMIDETYIKEVLEGFMPGDYILLQNEISNVPAIITAAKQKKLKIVFNPSPITDDLLQYPLSLVDLLVLNEIEGYELTRENEPERIINKIHMEYPMTSVLLTLGAKGAIFSDGRASYNQGVYKVKVVDTTAAGDTFTGYFLASYARGEAVPDCLSNASKASSIAVSRPGASSSIPYMTDVKESDLKLQNIE